MLSAFFIYSFLLFTQGVFSQGVDPWSGNVNFVENENGYALLFNGETAGATATGTFDTLNIDVNLPYTSACIEWWARYSKTTPETPPFTNPTPLQTLMFYGSVTDTNNYVWVSVANGTTGSNLVGPHSLFKFKTGGTPVVSPISFPSWDRHLTWTQFAICLQPSTVGQSYVFGLGDAGTGGGGPTYFTSTKTFADIAGTTSLIIGYLGAALQNEFDNVTNYGGRIGEIRIWNTFLTPSQLALSRYTSYPDSYPNLVHRYKFLEPSGNITYDSVGTANGLIYPVFSGTGPVRATNYFSTTAQADMVPYWILERTIPWNGVALFNIAANANPQVITWTTLSQGIFCLLGSCNTSTILNSAFISNAQFTADRRSCGLSTSILPTSNIGGTLTNYMNITITTTPFTGTVITQAAAVPTAGGSLVLTGSNLGLNGLFASAESVVVSLPNQTPFSCTSGSVNGNQISCTVPPGIGFRGNLTVTLCGTTYLIQNLFAYQAPIINPIPVATNFQTLSFLGQNFGPSRKFDGVNDNVQIVNGTTIISCNVSSNNDTDITCTASSPLNNGYEYQVAITIGGQTSVGNFTFQKCIPPCQHGTCEQTGVCNCDNTGFNGIDCNTPLVCQPTCINGVCIQKTDGTFNTTCSCNVGYAQPNCANLIQTPVPIGYIVGPVVAGTVTLIAISAIIIIVILRRQERREGSNFIPLEKKDFTKIIYGDQLNQPLDKKESDLQKLEKLLVEDDGLEVAFAISSITQITEADKIAKALVVVFQDNSKIIKLLESFITQEVKTTESAGTLFRANSMVSKMFKFYSRLIGLPYLYVTIGPELGKLIEEELGLEVDPEKMEEGRDLDEMRWALMSQSQKILKQILLSHEKCPSQFRSLFAHIAKQVRERFPENVNTTIGGFIFLRLFCPAVSSPEAYGIVEEPPSADARRLLILITKVLQNLSNDVEFGSKEPYMTKMNDFIQSNRPKLVTFYENLLKPPTKPAIPCEMPRNIKPLNLHILAQHIRENLDKIEDQKIKAKLQQALPAE